MRAAPRPPDRHSPLPLWAQVRDDLLRRLQEGGYADAVPGELDLVGQYGVSRHTVREALRRLRDAGVLESRRGRSSVVHRVEQPLGALYSLFRSVEGAGLRQHSQVLDLRVVEDPVAAAALGLAPDAELVHVERLRLAGDAPLAHDRAWLPADLARPLLDADLTRTALYDELASRCGVVVSGGRERIRARHPDAALRALLRLPRGTACLEVERDGRADGRAVEHRLTTLRGDRFTLTAEWSPRGSALGGS